MGMEGSWRRMARLPKRARVAASAGERFGLVVGEGVGSRGRVCARARLGARRVARVEAAVVFRNWRRFMGGGCAKRIALHAGYTIALWLGTCNRRDNWTSVSMDSRG